MPRQFFIVQLKRIKGKHLVIRCVTRTSSATEPGVISINDKRAAYFEAALFIYN